MTALANRQFEIDTAPFVPFGDTLPIRVRGFTPGSADTRDQDTIAVRGDHRTFGIDRKTPPTWSWSLWTDVYTETEAAALVDSLAQVWSADTVRDDPEEVVALRYRIMGRDMRVYGRPRRFTPVYDKLHMGKIYVEADFTLSEDAYYDDSEYSVQVGMGTGYTAKSGIILPQPLPWSFTAAPSVQSFVAVVGGSQKAWLTPTFHGPVVDPWVQIGSLTWKLTGTLTAGQTATVSGRPWDMGVWKQDGLASTMLLDPRSRLSQLRMAPGSYTVRYGGYDNTGSSKVIVRWRNARRSL